MSYTSQMMPDILFFDQNLETSFAADMPFFLMANKWEMSSFPVIDIW
jgi:hypothetical protein